MNIFRICDLKWTSYICIVENNHLFIDNVLKLNNRHKQIELMLKEYSKGRSDYPTIHKACEKDNYLKSEEALKIGLIDEIV